MTRILPILLLFLAIIVISPPAGADNALPLPVPHGTKPNWAPVPGVQGVQYAPSLAADLFRYGKSFYYLHGDRWYQGSALNGPWREVHQPPKVFYNIQAPYFKRPPGWAHGKKTGWGGAPMPPGQMKKHGTPVYDPDPYEPKSHGKPGKGKKWD